MITARSTSPTVITLTEQPECTDLLSAVIAGDRDALTRVYDSYGVVVYRLAYRISESAADAADVTQDVFTGLPEALRGLRATTWRGFEAWLRTVTARAALQTIRKQRRRREISLGDILGSQQASLADVIFDRIDLDRALGELPPGQRTVLVLKEIEGLSHEEIGEILGISVSSSQVRLHRAKRRLLRLLREA